MEMMHLQAAPIVRAQADFTLALLRQQQALNASTAVSPLSISMALAMIWLGARGPTAHQIKDAIARDVDDEEMIAYFSDGFTETKNSSNANEVYRAANRIYLREGLELEDEFKRSMEKRFLGGLQQMDFNNSIAAVHEINRFVNESTKGAIRHVLGESDLEKTLQMLLVNAISFNGTWDDVFHPSVTQPADFYSTGDNFRRVLMMESHHFLPYFETDNSKVVGIPFQGRQTSMFVFLPKRRFRLSHALSDFTPELLSAVFEPHIASPTSVRIKLPKFTAQTGLDLSLMLEHVGISEAFSKFADFSGITTGGDRVRISNAFHKTKIETNENGTTASGAKNIDMIPVSDVDPLPLDFIANQPFAYFVVNNVKKQFLFAGVYQ